MAENLVVNQELKGNVLNVTLKGRLDTNTAPSLEKQLKELITGEVKELIFDFSDLAYIASAGLRVLLSTQKIMSKQGKFVIKNVSEAVMEVFELTGFVDILTIE